MALIISPAFIYFMAFIVRLDSFCFLCIQEGGRLREEKGSIAG